MRGVCNRKHRRPSDAVLKLLSVAKKNPEVLLG
jgi:DNA-binding transcriptional regulator YiaG